jgi:hypothetical protein
MVSASQIARLAYCERQIRLDVVRGQRPTEEQRAARRRGEAEHRKFYEESRRLAERSAERGKCFIATMALDDSPETLALRQFRDLFLRRSAPGRAAVSWYYRHSPALCKALEGHGTLLALARWLLRLLGRVAAAAVSWRLRKEGIDGI